MIWNLAAYQASIGVLHVQVCGTGDNIEPPPLHMVCCNYCPCRPGRAGSFIHDSKSNRGGLWRRTGSEGMGVWPISGGTASGTIEYRCCCYWEAGLWQPKPRPSTTFQSNVICSIDKVTHDGGPGD